MTKLDKVQNAAPSSLLLHCDIRGSAKTLRSLTEEVKNTDHSHHTMFYHSCLNFFFLLDGQVFHPIFPRLPYPTKFTQTITKIILYSAVIQVFTDY